MTDQEIINAYIQAIKEEDVLTLENFLGRQLIEVTKKDLQRLFKEIHASDYYYLLEDKSIRTSGGIVPWFDLTPDGARALRKFPTLQEYCDHLDNQQMGYNKMINIHGNITFESGSKVNFLSDNAQINNPDEALEQLGKMIDVIKQNQKIDALLKAKLIDMYENLQQSIVVAKNEKLPLVDNLTSIASSMLSIFTTLVGS